MEIESTIHKDIISASIVEDYYNLSLKTLILLLFTEKNFPQVECLIKADSDNFLSKLERIDWIEKYIKLTSNLEWKIDCATFL